MFYSEGASSVSFLIQMLYVYINCSFRVFKLIQRLLCLYVLFKGSQCFATDLALSVCIYYRDFSVCVCLLQTTEFALSVCIYYRGCFVCVCLLQRLLCVCVCVYYRYCSVCVFTTD